MSNESDHSDRRLEQANYQLEQIKLITDSLKHLTTLAAGTLVLLATFLKDIFPKKNGALAVSEDLKLLIAASFVFLGISLLSSIFYIVLIAPPRAIPLPFEDGASEREIEGKKTEVFSKVRRRRITLTYWSRLVSASAFVMGILCFGAAVLINLKVF